MADHFVSLQLIGLTRAPSVKMKNERETVGIAQIAAQRDVLIIDDDIPPAATLAGLRRLDQA